MRVQSGGSSDKKSPRLPLFDICLVLIIHLPPTDLCWHVGNDCITPSIRRAPPEGRTYTIIVWCFLDQSCCLAEQWHTVLASLKEPVKLQPLKSCSWYFHTQFPRMSNNFPCRFDEPTAESIGIN